MRIFGLFARVLASACAALVSTAVGAVSQCAPSYLDRVPPKIVGTMATPVETTRELCFRHYALLHASGTLTAIWSAEHLTAQDAIGGDSIKRKNSFHAEQKLAGTPRATLADYKGFKDIWDRGHLTPADDMPDYPSQGETFTLANMVPQASKLNQRTWQYLEASLHVLAEQDGELFLVTGPIYSANPQRLRGHVAIPDYTFKAVYSTKTKLVTAFLATNRNEHVCWVISVAQLIQMSGLDPFPSVGAAAKANAAPWHLPPGKRTDPPDCKPAYP